MTIIRDIAIIAWLMLNGIPQLQAWYKVQVDMHYEIYAVESGYGNE
jgi:hypothetical protein